MVALCALLFFVAIYLYRRLQRLQHRADHSQKQKLEYWQESARIVALAVVQEQCDLSEGCLRLRFIMNQLGDPRELLEQMGEELKGFATHKNRQALPLDERFRQDKERFKIEQRYAKQMFELCQEIAKSYDFREA